MKRRIFVLLVVAGLLTGNLWAEETNETATQSAPSQSSLPFNFGFQVGNITIDGTNYLSLRLQPDLSLGKFGIGLDLNLEFDPNWNFRTSEWNTWQAVLSKILYIRYGLKNDPFYIKVGNIDDFTLGNGWIMRRFSNMRDFPSVKKLGLAFDMDFKIAGFESAVDNIWDWDIMGLRAYVRPLQPTKIFLIEKLEIGTTVAADLDPGNPTPPADKPYQFTDSNQKPVVVVGADMRLPVVSSPVFSLVPYLDGAFILGKGTGEAVGLQGGILSIIPYRFEVRILQPRFVPTYFDSYYESIRSTKYDSLDNYSNHYAGWAFNSGLSLMNGALFFDFTIEDDWGDASLPTLNLSLGATKEVLKLFDIKATWSRQNIAEWSDVFKYESENSQLGLLINYYASQNLILAIEYKRTFKLDENGTIQSLTTTSVSTRVTF
ncbi:hypothetical protein [Thermospira aquatica]|uniref:DUF5723 domain-containing protein n=1 Tax=Thermospira aquatica TaxID=2828656 RepID=A0AAX3BCT8_9SPIR|nr:hypothetical protein [Thermospira aquatica]URA10062.1 hypothetical protein KDW03_11355 [Thermospira aquatica]